MAPKAASSFTSNIAPLAPPMHISEGVLSGPVLLGGGALTVVGTAIGLNKLNYERIMTVALLASTFFVASLIHIPIGPGSVHLLLTGLTGLILGWSAFPAILVALLLQALFFQYGGLLVLGVNTFTMAAPAVACGLVLRPWLRQDNPALHSDQEQQDKQAAPQQGNVYGEKPCRTIGNSSKKTRRVTAAFLAGFCSIFLSALLTAGALRLSDSGLSQAATILVISHLPIMLIEGGITLFIVEFLLRVQPEILDLPSAATTEHQ